MKKSILSLGLSSIDDLYSILVETTEEGILCLTPDGHFGYVNDAFCRLVGYERSVLYRDKKLTDLLTPETLVAYQNKKDKRLAGKLREQFEAVFVHGQTGQPVYTLACVSPVLGKNGEFLFGMGVITDITPMKLMQAELEEQRGKMLVSSKLSALGEMAGGIAHEINTPLAIIQMRVEQVLETWTENQLTDELIVDTLQTIGQTAQRIAKIVNGLRHFSRDSHADPFVKTTVHDIIENTLSFCREKFKNRGVRIDVAQFDQTLAVECQGTQVSQVLLNLLNNAFDAVERMSAPWVRIEVRAASNTVDILIVDSGVGIAKEVLQKLFQPFFTTKEIGKGTGLGLSVSKGLVESQEGSLFIDEQAKNTCFVMRLPKTRAKRNTKVA